MQILRQEGVHIMNDIESHNNKAINGYYVDNDELQKEADILSNRKHEILTLFYKSKFSRE
jgi:hypothetical protein